MQDHDMITIEAHSSSVRVIGSDPEMVKMISQQLGISRPIEPENVIDVTAQPRIEEQSQSEPRKARNTKIQLADGEIDRSAVKGLRLFHPKKDNSGMSSRAMPVKKIARGTVTFALGYTHKAKDCRLNAE